MQGAGCREQGAGCKVQGAGCRVQGMPVAVADTNGREETRQDSANVNVLTLREDADFWQLGICKL